MNDISPADRYTLEELERLSGVSRRTIRYYIQLGLVARPLGETRAAFYSWQHLNDLLSIRRLTEAGLSLDAVRAQLRAATPGSASAAPTAAAPGTVQLKSHVVLAPGLEFIVDPAHARLSPQRLRQLARELADRFAQLQQEEDQDESV